MPILFRSGAPPGPASFRSSMRHNWATLCTDPLAEISGALGDLGTLLPLMLALAAQRAISLPATLVLSGLFNLLAGAVFGVPLPVQPMKALAASVIARRADPSAEGLAAAGMAVGTLCFGLAATGLLRRANDLVPVPIIKGIQLGAGLALATGAGTSLLSPLEWTSPWFDNRIWAFAVFLLLLITQGVPRFPFALVVFLAGIGLALTHMIPHRDSAAHFLPHLSLWIPTITTIPRLSSGALGMAIAQAPLTLLNSVIAASALSADLLPTQPVPTPASLAYSVAAMNAVGPWFGCMPVCHGSGGLAAQVRFGARSGASVMMLGGAKMLLGLFFGDSLLALLQHYPRAILGVTVVAAGVELSSVGMSLNKGASDLLEQVGGSRISRVLDDDERRQRWNIMLTTAAAGLAFKSDAVGFAAGLLCHANYRIGPKVADWWEAQTEQRRMRRACERRTRERLPLLG